MVSGSEEQRCTRFRRNQAAYPKKPPINRAASVQGYCAEETPLRFFTSSRRTTGATSAASSSMAAATLA